MIGIIVATTDFTQKLKTQHHIHWAEAIPWVIAIAVFYIAPGYRLLATQILVMILFALSLDLIVGYAGIISLGHTAFFGTGAYIAALLASNDIPDPIFGLFAAAVGAATIGVIVYNYTSREELRNPVPLHDEHHADIPTWIGLG